MEKWLVVLCVAIIVFGSVVVLLLRPEAGKILIELARVAAPVLGKLVEPTWQVVVLGVAALAATVALAYINRGPS